MVIMIINKTRNSRVLYSQRAELALRYFWKVILYYVPENFCFHCSPPSFFSTYIYIHSTIYKFNITYLYVTIFEEFYQILRSVYFFCNRHHHRPINDRHGNCAHNNGKNCKYWQLMLTMLVV